jgi:dTMP kinase
MIIEKELGRGVLIAFEGIDGAGKTTQAEVLRENLTNRGYKVVLLHEPTNSPPGRKVKESAFNGRHNPEEELTYFIEDRKVDVERNIRPALTDRKIVIMDRYYFSTIAYQGALGIDASTIRKLNEDFAPKPDLTILLDIAPTIGLSRKRRMQNSTPNHFEREHYLTNVRKIFLSITDRSVQVVDAARERDDISREILNAVLNILKPIERIKIEIER